MDAENDNQKLEFVKPLTSIINYRREQKELIEKAIEISNGDPISALKYIVLCLSHENSDEEIELVLVFRVSAMGKTTINVPINECEQKDSLGYYINWGDGTTTHNECSHTYYGAETKEYVVRIFGMGISGLGGASSTYNNYLTKVITFGNLGHVFTNLQDAFFMCNCLTHIPKNIPRSVRYTSYMFAVESKISSFSME